MYSTDNVTLLRVEDTTLYNPLRFAISTNPTISPTSKLCVLLKVIVTCVFPSSKSSAMSSGTILKLNTVQEVLSKVSQT